MAGLCLEKRAVAGSLARLVFGCFLYVAAGTVAVPSSAAASPVPAAVRLKPNPEALLIEIYKDLAANRLRDAEARADALVDAYPNFRLGHLIRGDLLLMHTQPVTTFGAVRGADDKLKNLREEAMVRLRSLRERPDPELVPRAILQLRDDQKTALVVDARRARLYVYENLGGHLRFVTDYYISHGRLGIRKVKAGDQKTPIGVYYITGRVPGPKLPDFYGTGALPLNYPNEWDRLHGRSGSGIWLHGTPSDSYSRPPLSSDGCVVLTNPDINRIYDVAEVGKTPVIISDSVEFVNKAKWVNDRNAAMRLFDDWRRNLEKLDFSSLGAFYSNRFLSERKESRNTWLDRQRQVFHGVRNMNVTLHDMSLFLYPGQSDLLVGTFTEEAVSGRFRNVVRKRQYWAREGSQWKIVSEAIIQ